MLYCHLVAIQLDRLASVDAHQQPPAPIQERGVGNAEQRDAGLLFVHAQDHAGGEVRQQRARGSGGRIGGAGNHAEPSHWRAAHQPLEVRGAFAEYRELRNDDDQLSGRLGRQPVQLAFEPLKGSFDTRLVTRVDRRHQVRQVGDRPWQRALVPNQPQPHVLGRSARRQRGEHARQDRLGALARQTCDQHMSKRRPGRGVDLLVVQHTQWQQARGGHSRRTRRLATDAFCAPASHAVRRPGRPKSRPRTRLPGDHRGSAPGRPAAAVRRVRPPGSVWSTSGHRRQRSGARCRGRTRRQAAAAGRRARSAGSKAPPCRRRANSWASRASA